MSNRFDVCDDPNCPDCIGTKAPASGLPGASPHTDAATVPSPPLPAVSSSSPVITLEEIDNIEAYCAAATKGQWIEGQQGNCRVYGPDGSGDASGLIAVVYKSRGNATFIANARVDLPRLCAELKRLITEAGVAPAPPQVDCDSWARAIVKHLSDATLELAFIRHSLTSDEVDVDDDSDVKTRVAAVEQFCEEIKEDTLACLTGDETGCLDESELNETNCELLWLKAQLASALTAARGEALEEAMKAICQGCQEGALYAHGLHQWESGVPWPYHMPCQALKIRALAYSDLPEEKQ